MKKLKNDLSNYNPRDYDDPSVTADIIIITIFDNDLKVLLIKRKNPPFRGYRAIPGGFLDVNREENLEETASRELLEETNLKNIYIEQLKTYGDVKRDPRKRVISVAYFALLPFKEFENQNIIAGDDAEDAQWFSLNKLPDKIAFDHKKILRDVLLRLRGKVSYTDIAFRLLPAKFTWSELQNVYEIILGRKLIAPNFRRKINSMYLLKELKQVRREGLGRPSRLLKYIKMRDL